MVREVLTSGIRIALRDSTRFVSSVYMFICGCFDKLCMYHYYVEDVW